MNPSSILTATVRRPAFRLGAAVLAGCSLLGGSLFAKAPVPENLSGGLLDLVQSRVELKQGKSAGVKLSKIASASGVKYSNQKAADIADNSITDDSGRVLVMIHLNGLSDFKTVRKAVKAISSLTVTAVDKTYKAGVLEGYVDVDDVADLAETWGVGSVHLEAKPEHNRRYTNAVDPVANATVGQTLTLLGTTFDQGVTQHRVDQINKFYNPSATLDYEGQGMQIGYISDSFGATSTVTTPAQDVANYDLPGSSSNPAGNTQPVVVLADYASGTDEGRAMVQIGYKMAPKARLAFATADTGEVGFANNIRALAALPGFTYPAATQQGFAADTICDDVGYSDEPFFEDGIVGNAVNDVAAAGVSYFSSAGNDIGTYDYDSDFKYVPNGSGLTAATNAALAGTNINLANVPTNLYQGGFHNFSPTGQDVALTYNLAQTTATNALPATNFQWNDPYNQTLTYQTPAIYTAPGSGDTSGGVTPSSFTTPSLTAGANYVIIVKATNNSPFDAIVTIKDPNGNTVVNAQDTGTDETVNFYPTITGQYTIQVAQFTSTAPTYPGGTFEVDIYNGNNSKISTDFNLLTFDLEGNYLPGSSLVTNNYSTNVPYEYGKTPAKGATTTSVGEGAVQYLVARSSIPTITPTADHFRILVRGNGLAGIGPAEYFTYNTPNTKGHAMANGCNGTAAYSVFRPSTPEYFTSPGPATVYFNNVGTRLAIPEVRLQPGVAAADNANNSFFASDDVGDLDTKPNFSGTSAAAPHAATIAALVLQAHGGPHSLTPAQMTSILHSTAFPHDLDPFVATGSARATNGGKISISVTSDLLLNPSAGAINPDSITLSYTGPGSLATLVFNPQGTAATAGNPTGGNNGVDLTNTYFSNIYPGIVFEPAAIPFKLGSSIGTFVLGTDVVPTFSNLAPAPSNGVNQYWTMTLGFPNGSFVGGKVLHFTVGHGLQHNRTVNTAQGTGPTGGATSTSFTQADLFGGTVLLPDGTGNGVGMTFSGTLTDGSTFSGNMKNNIGAGWGKVDGFGFINAQAAVSAPAP